MIAKRPPRAAVRLISVWRSLNELELRTFDYDPSYCLSSSGSTAVGTMTIRANTDIRRYAEAHLATITATSDFIVCHANYGRGCAVGRGLATGVALGVGVGVGLGVGVAVGPGVGVGPP